MLKDLILLERSIKSVLINFYKECDFEIIIINDNDDFDIHSVSFSFPLNFDNLKFFNNKGESGAGGARNFGVSQAVGELITFLDDDDFLLPGRLERMISEFQEHEKEGCVLLSTGRVFQYNDFENIELQPNQKFGIIQLKDIMLINDIDIGFMIRKELFDRLNGFDTSFTNLEDWEFIMRCLKYGYCYKLKTFSYVVNNDPRPGRVSNNSQKGLNEIALRYRKIYGESWYFKVKVFEYRLSKELNFKNFCYFTYKLKSFYPLRHYFPYIFKKIIHFSKTK